MKILILIMKFKKCSLFLILIHVRYFYNSSIHKSFKNKTLSYFDCQKFPIPNITFLIKLQFKLDYILDVNKKICFIQYFLS
jgi:hypothetical protein